MTKHPAKLKSVTWAEACARRIERQGLAEPVKAEQLAGQVGEMCGAHAQVMSAAELSIGLRVAGATRADVRKALADHRLIKTYGPRGTVHVLAADDLAMWTGALSAIPAMKRKETDPFYLTAEQTDSIVEAIADALKDNELTIDELDDAVIKRAGAWAGEKIIPAFQTMWSRWKVAISTAANRGALVFGENRGQKVTYTHPSRWISDFKPMSEKKALAGMVKRYLYAYGPATPQQIAKWLNGSTAWAASLFESLGDAVEKIDFEDAEAWIVAGDTDFPDAPPSGVHLLPYFDAYVVGSYPRGKLYPGKASERALAGGQAGNFPVLLIDGVVAGVWHQKRSGKKIAITVEPLGKLSQAEMRELEDQVERVGVILEGKPTLAIGEVKVGAHA